MAAVERFSRAEVLGKLLDTLASIRGSALLPGVWDQFEDAVAAIHGALDSEDLVLVAQKRWDIEKLDTRQQIVATQSSELPVKQSARARTASDNLSRRIKEELDKDGGQR